MRIGEESLPPRFGISELPPWFWCRDAGYLWWCHSVFCHGDEEDSRTWLLEIGKRRKPEIPAWEQGLMARERDGRIERWPERLGRNEWWLEREMAGLRDGQRGLAGMNDGLNKRRPEGIRVSVSGSDTMKNFWTPLLTFSVHTIHIYIHKWLNKKISI